MKRDDEKTRDELLEELVTLRRQVAQFSDEEALKDTETRFQTVVESLDEGLLITDLEDRVVYMNSRVTEMTGYTPEEIVGQLAYQLLLAPDKWSSLLERSQERGQGIPERYEMEMIRKDGSTFWASSQAIPYRDPLGKIVGTLGVIVDITDRRRTEEELIRLERLRALGEMAQGVAHNFNNLLVGMLGYAQLIQVKAQNAQISEDVMGIVDSALRAKELVQRLTRSVEGDRGSTPTAVWVQEMVDEAIEATRPRWKDVSEAKGVAVDVVTDLQDVPPIWGTREGMYDILVNLILNAVDAMPEGGTISLSAATSRTGLVLRVQDTGVGMDEETRRRVFEPFLPGKQMWGRDWGFPPCTVR
jgi:PAS domain S-box-containing protein